MAWTHSFVLVCVASGADYGSVDGGLVEVLVVVQHPRQISWTTFGRILDEEEKKS